MNPFSVRPRINSSLRLSSLKDLYLVDLMSCDITSGYFGLLSDIFGDFGVLNFVVGVGVDHCIWVRRK